MPVYEYECQACHRTFEYQQRMSDPEMTVCEACGGKLERVISRTAFQLKGAGWYKDLYASAKPAETKTPDAKAETKAEGAGKSETPAAKSESGTGTGTGTGSGTGTGTGTGSGSGSGTGTGTKAAAGAA